MSYTGPKSNDPDTYMTDLLVDENTALATPDQFKRLMEYSTSLPTGAYEGKRWKRHWQERVMTEEGVKVKDEGWQLGEYHETPELEAVGRIQIIWRELLVVQ